MTAKEQEVVSAPLRPGGWIQADLSFAGRTQVPVQVRYRLEDFEVDGVKFLAGLALRSADGDHWIPTRHLESPSARLQVWAESTDFDFADCRAQTQLRVDPDEVQTLSLVLGTR